MQRRSRGANLIEVMREVSLDDTENISKASQIQNQENTGYKSAPLTRRRTLKKTKPPFPNRGNESSIPSRLVQKDPNFLYEPSLLTDPQKRERYRAEVYAINNFLKQIEANRYSEELENKNCAVRQCEPGEYSSDDDANVANKKLATRKSRSVKNSIPRVSFGGV